MNAHALDATAVDDYPNKSLDDVADNEDAELGATKLDHLTYLPDCV